MKIYSRLAIVFLSTVGLFAPAHALVLAGSGITRNTTAPTNDDWCHIGWSNVGSVRGSAPGKAPSRAGVVYLCDDWFITTYHAWWYDRPTGVVVGVTGYTVDTNSMIRLTNSISGMDTNADVALFRVTQKPNLPPLNMTTMAPGGLLAPVLMPNGNKTIFMIGSGHPREDAPSYWTTNWTVCAASNAFYSGYKFWGYTNNNTSQNILRWGSNQIDTTRFKLTMPEPFGDVWAFTTIFNTNAGSDECQIAPIDSGGGVFYKKDGYWELAGLMSTMTQPDGTDPKGAAKGIADGGGSYIADLSYYRDQVMKIIRPNGWPDLTIVDPSPFTNNASPGVSVSIPIITRNQGTVVATNFYTELYLVPLNAPYTNVARAVFTTLGAGEAVTNTYTFTAPATPGMYYLIARADDGTNADGNVHESYENNNQSEKTVRILEVGSDLVIVDPSPVTNSASPGASVSIPITTRNRGTDVANNFNTVLYLVTSWSPLVYTNVAQAAFTTLGAGESVTNTYTFTAPATPGVYDLIAVADDNEQVPESYENNNQSKSLVRLLKVGPDLTASSSTNNVRIAAHLSGEINFVTRNNGADATGFETVLFLSPTNTVASMTNAVATNQFSNLPAGQSVTTNFTFKAPGRPGTYYLCALADGSGSVTELEEANNWSGMVTLEVFPMAMPWLNLLLE
jgi:hypothetical protein